MEESAGFIFRIERAGIERYRLPHGKGAAWAGLKTNTGEDRMRGGLKLPPFEH